MAVIAIISTGVLCTLMAGVGVLFGLSVATIGQFYLAFLILLAGAGGAVAAFVPPHLNRTNGNAKPRSALGPSLQIPAPR